MFVYLTSILIVYTLEGFLCGGFLKENMIAVFSFDTCYEFNPSIIPQFNFIDQTRGRVVCTLSVVIEDVIYIDIDECVNGRPLMLFLLIQSLNMIKHVFNYQ